MNTQNNKRNISLYVNAILLCNMITGCIDIAKCWGAKYESAKCGGLQCGGAKCGAQSVGRKVWGHKVGKIACTYECECL